jgi:uncharacterized iron-regulated protein
VYSIAVSLIVAALSGVLGQAAAFAQDTSGAAARQASAGYVPQRVYDTQRARFVDFEVMLADLTRADVIFVGEQHDDANTHRLEHAVLDGLRRRNVPITVSLEMFERDVQEVVARYLADAITEAQLLKDARPWPRYSTDYRALVELAKTERWRVVAANVPRRFASDVAKSGRETLDRLSAEDRRMVASDLQCPRDAYFQRFAQAMEEHADTPAEKSGGDKPVTHKPVAETPPPKPISSKQAAMTERYYWSQCVKDETMAESIATTFDPPNPAPGAVVHFTGAFHSDFGQGTVERTRRRLPGRRVAILTILPVADLDSLSPAGEDLKRAHYLVYTVK